MLETSDDNAFGDCYDFLAYKTPKSTESSPYGYFAVFAQIFLDSYFGGGIALTTSSIKSL